MKGRTKFWVILCTSIASALVVLVVAALLVAQSQWFGNFVKEKVVATIEDSTGGRAEIGAFEFDPWHLTVKIRNFVLHGTEAATAEPLARVALLELHLKLLAGLKKTVDLAYLGIEDPRVNLLVNADGTTNVPSPKVKKAPSQTSGLETVVDLAVGQFKINNGSMLFSQRAANFSALGKDLRVLLNFNSFNSSYEGRVLIDPLEFVSGNASPLRVAVNVPLLIEKDAISTSGARLVTGGSQLLINAGLRDLKSPKITARVNANVSLTEMQKSFNLPLDLAARNVPTALAAELGATYDDKTSVIQVQAAHLKLGRTNFEASGTIQPGAGQSLQFNGTLALDELSRLAKLSPTQLAGTLQVHGHAAMDAKKNYAVDGTLYSQALSVRSGTTDLENVQLSGPFHADPFLISMDGLRLSALGGNLSAKIFVEKLERLSIEGHLNGFSIPVLARTFTGHPLGYDGTISGVINAKSNLKVKGTAGLSAQTQLLIAPGTQGVPLGGSIDGHYNGATGLIDLRNSYLALPHSRVDLSGNINQILEMNLISHNLNDFLPAVNFGSTKQTTSLPVVLNGGAARLSAQIKGNLSAPQITAHAAADHFVVEGSAFQQAAVDLAASQTGMTLSNGVLTSPGLRSSFDASLGLRKWQPMAQSPLSANVSVPNGDIKSLLALAGEKNLPASGKLNAEVHIRGTYGDPLGNASLNIQDGVLYDQSLDKVQANVDLAHQLITLSTFEVNAAGGQLRANGMFRHPSDSFQVGHAEFHLNGGNVQLKNIVPLQRRSPGASGLLSLVADGAGDLRKSGKGSEFQISNISSDLSARGLQVNNQAAGDLTGTARTSNGAVTYNLHSNFAGSAIQLDGKTSLSNEYLTKAVASIQNLPVEKALAISGQGDIAAKGILSANANVSGPIAKPDALLDLTFSKGVVYTEIINRFSTKVHYSNTQVDVPSLNLDVPAGTLTATAQYSHRDGDFDSGHLRLHVNSSDLDLSKIKHLTQVEPGFAGGLQLLVDVDGDVAQQAGKPALKLAVANADLNAHSLRANGRDLGNLRATANTKRNSVQFDLVSDLAQSNLRATGETQLNGDYPTHAKLLFGNIRYANLAPFIPSDNPSKPGFDALVEGEASVDGPVMNLDALAGRVQLNQLSVKTTPRGTAAGAPGASTVQIQNEGPAILTLNHSVIKIQPFKLQGPKTSLEAGGSLSLKKSKNELAVTLKGNADLGLLQDASKEFYSSGAVVVDATVHGSVARPLVNGQVELKNANVNYVDSPNGLSNANGVILLNGTNATIQNLTGESGGGKLAVTGFAGYTPTDVVFNLRTVASKVRARYAGASLTSSADISLVGNLHRSTLNGNVTIQRVAYSSSSDAGSLLSGASVPPSSPSAPSPFLSGMHLDVRVVTAPDLRVVTTYAQKVSLTSNLSIRGTAQDPGIVGRLNVTNGELVFFGNTYTVNTGSVNFYNPNAIQPILDLSLETIAQGVDVTLGVTGPMNDLKLSYRSDPPLSFEQIVQLLATNTTPSDPTIAAHQPTPPSQSLSQMGESAVLGQAVANPLASRVQRVFGLSQFKIDPSFSGSNGQPSARVTLQQKIANNLTFTYITDVTQTNSQIIRVQFDLTPKISAVALRDYNGNVSVEVFYKFQVR